MKKDIYNQMFKNDVGGWRSAATRRMLFEFWKNYRTLKYNYKIFELGPGGGATLKFFEKFGTIYGLDVFEDAVRCCLKRGITNVILARGGEDMLPLKSNSFDLCLAIDVIEHIHDDQQIMNELYRVCTPKGMVVAVIPAFQFLWSERDVRLGHYKRYNTMEIHRLTTHAGFNVLRLSYINLFYFPMLWLVVKIKRGRVKTDIATMPKWLNLFLSKMLDIETLLLKKTDFPFGCSTILVAMKN